MSTEPPGQEPQHCVDNVTGKIVDVPLALSRILDRPVDLSTVTPTRPRPRPEHRGIR